MFVKIQSPGERLKEIRVEILHVTQEQLADGNFSKSYISALERGRESMTPEAALKLSESINKIAKKRKIKINEITPDYFLEGKDTQIFNSINKFKLELKSKEKIEEIEIYIAKIESFISKYDNKIDEEIKYEIYEIAYNKYYKNYRFYECKIYIIKCLEIAKKLNKNTSHLVLTLTRIYGFLGEYENIIAWGKIFLDEEYIDEEALKTINYNVAKAYKKIDKYDECIEIIEKINSKFIWTQEEELRSQMLLARCYKEKGYILKARHLYYETFKKAKKINSKAYVILAYANVSEIYELLKEYNKSLMFLEKALNIENNEYKREIQPSLYFKALNIYSILDKTEKSIEYFEKALSESEMSNNQGLQVEIYEKIINYCIKKNMKSYILKIILLIESKIYAGILTDKNILDILHIASWHFKTNDDETFDIIYNKILNIIIYFKEKKCK